jgi:hypothetical protein
MVKIERIYTNTDNVDIEQKCLGLHVVATPSSANADRGLHVQIRHNAHHETFEAAIKLQYILAASILMQDTLKAIQSSIQDSRHDGYYSKELAKIDYALNKAEGKY